MKSIRYQIRLDETIIVSSLSGDPNSAVSYSYLPGSVLRGFFTGRYLQSGIDLSHDQVARRLFLTGMTRWLNAYPIDRLGYRSLPAPFSLHRIKGGEDSQIFDLAIDSQEKIVRQWSRINSAFCRLGDDTVRFVDPIRKAGVHTLRTRRYARAVSSRKMLDPKKGDLRGAFYRYEALGEGQVFEGIVLCEDRDEQRIRNLLKGRINIGKSQKGGYGQAIIERVSPESDEWQGEYLDSVLWQTDTDRTDYTGKLVVTLLSDLVLRDDNTGQCRVDEDAVREFLQSRLGGSLSSRRAYFRQTIAGGFNRKWGLPLPQCEAYEKGSVFSFDAVNIDQKKIGKLLDSGIGERRAEGFGRLAFNWQTEPVLTRDDTRAPARPERIELEGEDKASAERIAGRILRQRLAKHVTTASLRGEITDPPPKSQLTRLRGLIHEELVNPAHNTQPIIEYVKKLGTRAATRSKFSKSKIVDMPLHQWLESQLEKTDDVQWRGILDIMPGADGVRLGRISVSPTAEMKREYLLRYLDAFLARSIKEFE